MEEAAGFPRILSLVSIVVPAYVGHREGWSQLEACLGALGQHREAGWDILIVDDGSPSYGPQIEALALEKGVRYFRMAEQSGPAAARNFGVRQSSAPIVVFVDADTEVHADTISLLAERLERDPSLAAVIGSYDAEPVAPGLVSRFRNLMHCYVHHRSAGEVSTFWSGCGAIRRENFEALGGFDETYEKPSIEDVELGCRLHAAGGRIWLDPQAQVRHWKDFSLRTMVTTDLWQRAVPWTELWRKYPLPKSLNFSWRERLAALSVALLLPLLWLALLHQGSWWLLVAAALLLLGGLKLPLLQFLARHGGPKMAAAGFGLTILHLGTALLGLGIGTWKAESKRDRHLAVIAGALLLLLFGMQFVGGAYVAEYGGHPDEAAHFVSALAVHDYALAVMRGEAPAPWQAGALVDWAGQYYLHYPRVALGHWPPLWPILLSSWMLFFGVSRVAVMLLLLLLGWASLLLFYRFCRQVPLAMHEILGTILLVVATPVFQQALSMAMSEMLVLASSVLLLLALSEYLKKFRSAQPYGVLTAVGLGLMSKGTAACWGLLLPLLLAGARLRPLSMVAVAAPFAAGALWYFSMGGVADWGGMKMRWTWPIAQLGELAGWGVVALAGIGAGRVLLRVWLRAGSALGAAAGAAAALVLSVVFGSFVLRAMAETRHWLIALVPLVLLAFFGVFQVQWRDLRILAILAGLGLFPWGWVHQEPYGAKAILQQIGTQRRILLALNTMGEGTVIAAASTLEPRPTYFLVRGSKVLAESGWSGDRYRLLAKTPDEVLRRLDELGIEAVLVSPARLAWRRPHMDLARKSLEQSPVWKTCAGNANIEAYCRQSGPGLPRKALEMKIRGRIFRERL